MLMDGGKLLKMPQKSWYYFEGSPGQKKFFIIIKNTKKRVYGFISEIFPEKYISLQKNSYLCVSRYILAQVVKANVKDYVYVYVHIKTITWKLHILNLKNSRVIYPWSLQIF